MLPSGKDLYACGAGVLVPSIRVGEERERSYGPATKPRRRHTVAGDSLLRSQLGQLRHSLRFTEEVVSSRSPHSISYKQARGRLGEAFLPSLPLKKTQRRAADRDGRPYERRRHLCYLHGPPHPPARERASISHSESVSIEPLSSAVCSLPSCPSGMLYRRLKTVPASKSVQWEERMLEEVTSSTARRLGGGRKRDEEFEGKLEEVKETESVENEEGEGESRDQNYPHCLERGAKPIWRRGRGDLIVLDNSITFTKVLQKSYPQPHSEWCEGEEEDGGTVVKGGRRWTDLPQPAPVREIRPPTAVVHSFSLAQMPQYLQWVSGERSSIGSDDRQLTKKGQSPPPSTSGKISSQQRFCHILREWSRRRAIHVQPEEMTEAAVLRNIVSLNDSSRMKGMVACVSLAEQRISEEVSESGSLGEVVAELGKVVGDGGSTGVHVPAAIALHCLGTPSQTAVEALLQAVEKRGGDDTDEWAGLQCLVEAGVCEECVVKGLQMVLLNCSDPSFRQRAGELLARLSDRMPLVHALLAEQLTSRGWQERLSACLILPSLLCPLSADVCSRLVVMSWEDWSSSVRDAASQALGKTGHGKLLHDELVRRLNKGVEVVRLDALRKIHCLELMTPQLLSAFLPSLSDQHASIRVEAIAICGQLAVRDEVVLQRLIHLLGDPIWMIRAHTLRALESIGCSDRNVMEQLLWSVCCDKVPAVRAEACHTLIHLWQRREKEGEEMKARMISTLRDRLVVEDNAMVTGELVQALQQLGGSVEREDPMASFISSEVQRLGTCRAITEGVVEGDRQTLTDYIIRRPPSHLTTRDYLTPHQRNRFYSRKAPSVSSEEAESAGKRVWSPDRETIEEHLTAIQRLCLSSPAQLQ